MAFGSQQSAVGKSAYPSAAILDFHPKETL